MKESGERVAFKVRVDHPCLALLRRGRNRQSVPILKTGGECVAYARVSCASVVGEDTQQRRKVFNLAFVGRMPVANWVDCVDTSWLSHIASAPNPRQCYGFSFSSLMPPGPRLRTGSISRDPAGTSGRVTGDFQFGFGGEASGNDGCQLLCSSAIRRLPSTRTKSETTPNFYLFILRRVKELGMPVANWVDCVDLPTGRQARVGWHTRPRAKPAPVLCMREPITPA